MALSALYEFLPDVQKVKALEHISNQTLGSVGLAIKAAESADAKTANAVAQCISGVINSLAAIATIDLSALSGTSIPDGSGLLIVLFANASDTVSAIESDVTTDTAAIAVPDYAPAGLAPFGAIKIVNGSGSAFTVGTTALDTSDVTVTYYNLSWIAPGMTL